MSQRSNKFQEKSRSNLVSRTCSPKTRIVKVEDDWKYNNDNLQMQLKDGKVFRIEKFRICYGNFDEKGSGNGIIYQKFFDECYNQKYCIQEGYFINYKIQSGMEYAGKSKKLLRVHNNKEKQKNYCKIIEIMQPIKKKKIINITSNFKQNSNNQVKYKPYANISELKQQMSKTQTDTFYMTKSMQFNSSPNYQQDSFPEIKQEIDNYDGSIKKMYLFLGEQQESIQQQLITQVSQILKRVNKEISEQFQSLMKQPQISEIKSCKESWTKYDQNFYQKDLDILADNSKQWLNSSILDAYAVYLNKQNEEEFWQYKNKLSFRRTLLIPTYITTSFFQNPNYDVRDYFLEYEGIDYKIGIVYRDICFIINMNNTHWVFARVDMELNLIQLYDSLSLGNLYSTEIKKKLTQLFQSIYKQQQEFKFEYPRQICKQNNTYECGIYSCIYAKWVSEGVPDKPFCSNFEMRQILRQIISPK